MNVYVCSKECQGLHLTRIDWICQGCMQMLLSGAVFGTLFYSVRNRNDDEDESNDGTMSTYHWHPLASASFSGKRSR